MVEGMDRVGSDDGVPRKGIGCLRVFEKKAGVEEVGGGRERTEGGEGTGESEGVAGEAVGEHLRQYLVEGVEARARSQKREKVGRPREMVT